MKDTALVLNKKMIKIISKTMEYVKDDEAFLGYDKTTKELVFILNNERFCFKCGLIEYASILERNNVPQRIFNKYVKKVLIPISNSFSELEVA